MVLAKVIHGLDPHFSTQNAKLKKRPHAHIAHKGEIRMDKYDVIGLVIAILAVSVVLMH
jgi:hypothetical protein